jgi:hypothetical protein
MDPEEWMVDAARCLALVSAALYPKAFKDSSTNVWLDSVRSIRNEVGMTGDERVCDDLSTVTLDFLVARR